MPCLASFFDAMSGVKKLPSFVPAVTWPNSANEHSKIVEYSSYIVTSVLVMSAFHMKDRLLKLVKPRQKTTPNMTLGYPLLNTYLWHHFLTPWLPSKS